MPTAEINCALGTYRAFDIDGFFTFFFSFLYCLVCLKILPHMMKVAKNRTWAWHKDATTGAPKVRVGPLEQVWPPLFKILDTPLVELHYLSFFLRTVIRHDE